jgi:hypothetical protein
VQSANGSLNASMSEEQVQAASGAMTGDDDDGSLSDDSDVQVTLEMEDGADMYFDDL